MTSGSPPVLSISLSDHSFSALASSFAFTLAHSRPLWRFIFFSKRAFKALSNSSRCSGDNSFFVSTRFIELSFLSLGRVYNCGKSMHFLEPQRAGDFDRYPSQNSKAQRETNSGLGFLFL